MVSRLNELKQSEINVPATFVTLSSYEICSCLLLDELGWEKLENQTLITETSGYDNV